MYRAHRPGGVDPTCANEGTAGGGADDVDRTGEFDGALQAAQIAASAQTDT
jgi:hypothetical protein